MKKNIFDESAKSNEDKDIETQMIQKITECPVCGCVIDPRLISYDHVEFENAQENVFGTFYCKKCNSVFFAKFHYSFSGLFLINVYPKTCHKCTFSQSISDLSPVFVKCFNQSTQAESENLNLIAGVGYRKALEFLIKDFAIFSHSDDESKIKSMRLAQVIDKYIDNNRIQNLAKAASWLGNDETHYERKTDYDLNDMKRFIKAAVNYIENEFIFYESVKLTTKKETPKK